MLSLSSLARMVLLTSQACRQRSDTLNIFAFDVLHREGFDLRSLPLTERRWHLERLLAWSEASCLHLVQAFNDGMALLKAAERHGFEGIVSKRRDAPYRSGPTRDWMKMKTTSWRAANRERWRPFEKAR
jgi:bifunctional non-homologous end joining protein LigD